MSAAQRMGNLRELRNSIDGLDTAKAISLAWLGLASCAPCYLQSANMQFMAKAAKLCTHTISVQSIECTHLCCRFACPCLCPVFADNRQAKRLAERSTEPGPSDCNRWSITSPLSGRRNTGQAYQSVSLALSASGSASYRYRTCNRLCLVNVCVCPLWTCELLAIAPVGPTRRQKTRVFLLESHKSTSRGLWMDSPRAELS